MNHIVQICGEWGLRRFHGLQDDALSTTALLTPLTKKNKQNEITMICTVKNISITIGQNIQVYLAILKDRGQWHWLWTDGAGPEIDVI